MESCQLPTLGTSSSTIDEILSTARTLAIVGLSADPAKPSNAVAAYMKKAGFRIIPVTPYDQEILGETSYPDLAKLPDPPDVVVVFRRPDAIPPIADAAIARGAKALWLQLGIVHNEALARAEAAGLKVVQDRCIKIEHSKRPGAA